jgi:hypothetical protein
MYGHVLARFWACVGAFLHHLIWPGDSSMVHEVDPPELSVFASNFFAQMISDALCLFFCLFMQSFCISAYVLSSQLPDLLLLSELKVHSRKVACCSTHFSLRHF